MSAAAPLQTALDSTADTYVKLRPADLLAACEAAGPTDQVAASLLPLARAAVKAESPSMMVSRPHVQAVVRAAQAEPPTPTP